MHGTSSYADDANYFVGLILRKLAQQDVDDQDLVRLRAEYLRKVMSFRHYHAVIDALLEYGAVERSGYTVDVEPFGYRLANRFVDDKHVRVAATDQRLIGRLKAYRAQTAADCQTRMLPVHHALAKLQHQLEIHGDQAREILSGLPPKSIPYDVQGIQIGNIENREFHFNVGQYGRVSNSITSLKRELRTALHVAGKPLGNVDISCAQPAFQAKLIRENE